MCAVRCWQHIYTISHSVFFLVPPCPLCECLVLGFPFFFCVLCLAAHLSSIQLIVWRPGPATVDCSFISEFCVIFRRLSFAVCVAAFAALAAFAIAGAAAMWQPEDKMLSELLSTPRLRRNLRNHTSRSRRRLLSSAGLVQLHEKSFLIPSLVVYFRKFQIFVNFLLAKLL